MFMIFAISILIAFFYSFCILYFLPRRVPAIRKDNKSDIFVSIIVPFRNEEANLPALIDSILKQDYPRDKFELILVNDHSEDSSIQVISRVISTKTKICVNILNLPSHLTGKKDALILGASTAKGNLILLTDADCTMGEKWISSMVNFQGATGKEFVQGPISFKGDSFFQKIQSLEMAGLVGLSRSSIEKSLPLLSNGANLAISRALLKGENVLNNRFGSGDDMFLMLNCWRENKANVGYNPDLSALVQTNSLSHLNAFYNQRKRWAAKSLNYKLLHIEVFSLLVFLINFSILCNLIVCIFNPKMLVVVGFQLTVKMLVDFCFLKLSTGWLNGNSLMKYFFPLQLFSISYIPAIGLISKMSGYSWKDRIWKK